MNVAFTDTRTPSHAKDTRTKLLLCTRSSPKARIALHSMSFANHRLLAGTFVGTDAVLDRDVRVGREAIASRGTIGVAAIDTAAIDTAAVGTLSADLFRPRTVHETLVLKSSATGTVDHDLDDGCLFFHSDILDDFTCNVTHVPTAPSGRAYVVTLILQQGASTAHSATALTVNGGDPVTLLWPSGTAQTPTNGSLTFQTFTLMRVSDAWIVTTQLANFAEEVSIG